MPSDNARHRKKKEGRGNILKYSLGEIQAMKETERARWRMRERDRERERAREINTQERDTSFTSPEGPLATWLGAPA